MGPVTARQVRPPRLRPRIGRVALAVRLTAVVSLALALLAPAGVLAADPTFEKGTSTQKFGENITVEQRVTLPSGVVRVEAYVRTPGTTSTFLATVPNPGAGTHTLTYVDETPSGSVMPNTVVELGFRITLADGSFVDGPPIRVRYEDDRFAWQTLEGDIVRIHWYEGSQQFGQRALDIGDKAVRNAAALLGVEETVPIDFYVYADRDAFYDVLGPSLQENVGGLAIPEIRTLFANIAPSDVADPWVSLVVPHELTHIVFDTATRNAYHSPPHWLNEGLADYLAIGYASDARNNVEQAARAGDLMPLHAIVLRFPSTADRFSLAYDESVSAVDYLIRTYGKDALVKLIRSYADGVSDDAAFTAALGVDAAGFEAGWLSDVGVKDPAPFGPKPAPPGPLPPGWGAAPVASGPPVATPPPASGGLDGGSSDVGTTIVIGVVLLFGIVVVLGIIVVARGLNRGDALLPPPAGPSTWSSSQPSSPDREPPPAPQGSDLAALDARFAPGPADPPGPPDMAPAGDLPEAPNEGEPSGADGGSSLGDRP
jgi:hypothetical protein